MYLGFDFGTQSVKAVLVNENLETLQEVSVNFDTDLTEFRTAGGVKRDERNPKIVTAPPLMWLKALDIVLEKLRLAGVAFEQILGISGAAQQHGSVYWKRGARETLKNLNPQNFLHEELAFAFAVPQSPVWMDSSTTSYCKILEDKIGGPENLSHLTGSRAYERFTLSQIAKIYDTRRELYNATERISLVSSFACSVFLGNFASIDYSDGSGMNLLDIRTKAWSDACAAALTDDSGDLIKKLGDPVTSDKIQGQISPYFTERFGFSPECQILSFTGDNPSSFAGMRLGSSDIAVSLGTSDTLFLSLKTLPDLGFIEGHILIHPLCSEEYMALLCFKNGSLTRDRIKKTVAEDSWTLFNELLESTPRGNFGNIGFYFDLEEILPKVTNGDHRFNRDGIALPRFSGLEIEVRALIEGQFLGRRLYAEKIGCKITKETRILATGGASTNRYILQVLADVFNAPVYTQDTINSADLGACYRLKYALDSSLADGPTTGTVLPVSNHTETKHKFQLACTPSSDAAEIYDPMLQRYADLLEGILQNSTRRDSTPGHTQ